ncbi:MAG: TetR/AcrR family transcriptional regulator [Lysobacteraceae bacterium]
MKAGKVVRRRPRQARSQSTVDALYEATVQIIEREGSDRITMKRVSDVSGYSIGTLYQYFQDRDSLLLAMSIAYRDRLIERLKTVLAASCEQSLRDAVASLVGALVADARCKRKTLRAVVRAVTSKGMAARMLDGMRTLDDCIARALAELAAGHGATLSPASRFVVSRSLTSVLWSAVMEESDLLDAPELEDRLCRMVATMMSPDPLPGADHAAPEALPSTVRAQA